MESNLAGNAKGTTTPRRESHPVVQGESAKFRREYPWKCRSKTDGTRKFKG